MDAIQKNMLAIKATEIRIGAFTGIYNAQSGHPGGSLSIADILSYLYFNKLNVDPKDPTDPMRDRVVLSKGHAAPALYAALAAKGYFPMDDLKNLRQIDSNLQGHPDMKHIPGVDMSSGSLGQGISAACGIALGGLGKFDVYTILGDGECGEGQVWEAAMFASHYKLENLTAFVDVNGLQIDGTTADVMNSEPIDKKFEAFGWRVITIDAHDFDQIDEAVKAASETRGRPTCIICKSVKGKGVSFMENKVNWHGAAPKQDLYEIGMAELEATLKSYKEVG